MKPVVLVCTLNRASCHRLIRAGKRLAERHDLPLRVLSVQPEGLVSPTVAETIQVVHNLSSAAGAQVTVLFSDSPALTTAVHAKQQNAAFLVCDRADMPGTAALGTLRELVPEITLSVLETDGRLITFPTVQPVSAG